MHLFHLIFGPAGRIQPGCFISAVLAIYVVGLAVQLLTAPAVLARAGLWPFLLAQAFLTWIWFVLHAKRLRDVGRSIALAEGILIIHVLAVALLILVGAFVLDSVAAPENSSPVSIAVLRHVLTLSRGLSDPLTILGLVACASLTIAPVFSIWSALQPSQTALRQHSVS